ncbi:MAG: hypothetical protein ACYCX3_08330 [Thermoleophilia bacterium]
MPGGGRREGLVREAQVAKDEDLGAVVTMGLACFFIRERLESQQGVGVVLALLGVVAIATSRSTAG